MPHIKLLIEFDGTDFHGWQQQAEQRTVQGVLEEAIASMNGERTPARASSRTDAGVHARAMPVCFRAGRSIPPRGWLRGLNSLLPRDLSVHSVEEVADDFDPRRSARGKTYRYRIWNAPHPSALEARTSWLVHPPLDLDVMRQSAQPLLGEHDFSAFRAAHCDSRSTMRLVEDITVQGAGAIIEIAITANAFLRNMARIVAGTLVEAGLGRRSPTDVALALASGERARAGVTAPPHGLFLEEVRYP
ncbi:MAG: tRNA pseudouridine synthase A [Myxococcales bacterium]